MMPPPTLDDIDGDEASELVGVSNDGSAAIVDQSTEDVHVRYERNVPIFTYSVLAAVDADSRADVFVMYGNSRIGALLSS